MLQFMDCAIREGKFQDKLVKVAVDPVQSSKSSPGCLSWAPLLF